MAQTLLPPPTQALVNPKSGAVDEAWYRFFEIVGVTLTNLPSSLTFLDEDNMVSDSATAVASQQSIKAYVDNSIILNSGTAQATTAGTSFPFTGIPSWAKRITIIFDSVSVTGTDNLLVQIGDSGGIETTGYVSSSTGYVAVPTIAFATSTAGFIIRVASAARAITGLYTLDLATGTTWSGSFTGASTAGDYGITGGGTMTLSATLDRVTVTRTGADTFDGGQVNILYE
jgi:hypothetical protein